MSQPTTAAAAKGVEMVWNPLSNHVLVAKLCSIVGLGGVTNGFVVQAVTSTGLNITGFVAAGVAIATTIVTSFLYLRNLIRKDQKEWELQNKDSFAAQIAEAKKQTEEARRQTEEAKLKTEESRKAGEEIKAQMAELLASHKKERESIHAQRQESQNREMRVYAENDTLRKDLNQTTKQMLELAQKLATAERRNNDLMLKIEQFQLAAEKRGKQVIREVKRVAGKVVEKVSENAESIADLQKSNPSIPVMKLEIPMTPDPDCGPNDSPPPTPNSDADPA